MLTLRIEPTSRPVPSLDAQNATAATVWRDLAGEVCAWAAQRDGERWLYIPDVASYRLAEDRAEIHAVAHPSVSPQRVRRAYLRTVLPMAVQAVGHEVLHASAVRAPAGVVGFCAVSTTGKSTLAAELSRCGFELWADDALALDVRNDGVTAVALPFESFVRGPVAPAERRASNAAAPIAAVCVLGREADAHGDRWPRIRQLSPADAFVGLLTHAYCYTLDDAARKRAMVATYLRVADAIPVFEVIFRPGLQYLDETVDGVASLLGRLTR
ncbi:MAG: hypothetical protein ICV64_04705 [Thermoleophilia bacterium]|nr:hypothetical protein [Thermoleophilia bacterium]